MSRIKVNTLNPFSGNNINFGGHAVPSGSGKNLGTEANAWTELYVSTGSVNFVAPITLGQPTVTVASLKAGGESGVSGPISGMIFTETNNNLRGSFSVGRNNTASGIASLTVGLSNTASGNYSLAQGMSAYALGTGAHAEGQFTTALGGNSHAEGLYTQTTSTGAHSEGFGTIASGGYSHAEGAYTTASGTYSHAEGTNNIASGIGAHAEGQYTIASGDFSHAEGTNTIASGPYSHAEGSGTRASGTHSHAQGYYTTASGNYSFVAGREVVAPYPYQVMVGQYNALNNTGSIFVVGAGTSNTRKDGFSVESDGTRAHIVIPANQGVPANPKQGSMFFNQDTNLLYIHNGTTWRSASFA